MSMPIEPEGGSPQDELTQNIAAAHEQLQKNLEANDPAAAEFNRFSGKELDDARKAMGLPKFRKDDTSGTNS
jgi:hypothetical protein